MQLDIYFWLGLALNNASSFGITYTTINKYYESFAAVFLIQSFHTNNFPAIASGLFQKKIRGC